MFPVLLGLTVMGGLVTMLWIAVARGPRGGLLGIWVAGLVLSVIPLGIFSPWWHLFWTAGFLLALCLAGTKLSRGRIAAWQCGVLGLYLGLRFIGLSATARELDQLKVDYPRVDLTARLATLTTRARTTSDPVSAMQAENVSPTAWLRNSLSEADFEQRLWEGHHSRRERMLHTMWGIHDSVVGEFHRREGFGAIRTIGLSPRHEVLELAPAARIPQPAPNWTQDPNASWLGEQELPPPNPQALREWHLNGQLSFFVAESLGFARRDSQGKLLAVGFQSHAFRALPDASPLGDHWEVAELELVSLLKATSPAVYQSDSLPNLDELTHENFPTRPLVEFEQRAIAELAGGTNLVTEQTGTEFRAVGALRSVEQCRGCHEVPDGTLLGAFTYRLRPTWRPVASAE